VIFVIASIVYSGGTPTGIYPGEVIEIPSFHQAEHEEHSNLGAMRISGVDGGAELNRTVFGFLPYWVDDVWLRYDLISVLSCFCVDIGSSGNITAWNGFPGAFEPAIDSIHTAGGIAVITVVNFTSSSIHSILTTNRESAISTIVSLVTDYSVDGVSIDFEGVNSSDIDNLTAFMGELRDDLDSAAPGSHLSICTPPVDWNGAFDYSALAEICDALFMMCYNFHGSWSTVAGPCCPLTGWGSTPESASNMMWCLGDYTIYAPEVHDKLVVGFPYYGFQWETEDDRTHSGITGSCSTLFYTTLVGRAETYGRLWDTESLTPWYVFNDGGWNQGWYDDSVSLGLKYDIVRMADMQGIGIWALGYDGSRNELWNCIENSFCGEAWQDSITDNLESTCAVYGPAEYWRNVTEGGLFHSYFYTLSVTSGPEVNWIEWTFNLPDSSQSYFLDVWLPAGGIATVDYRVNHGGYTDTVTVDQSLYSDVWVQFGGPWSGTDGLSVTLGDVAGVSGEKIVADAVRYSSYTGIETSPDTYITAPPIILNSCNPAGSFNLTLPSFSVVTEFTIFDISGRVLLSYPIEAGDEIDLIWPLKELPSGIYYCTRIVEGLHSTLELVLVK